MKNVNKLVTISEQDALLVIGGYSEKMGKIAKKAGKAVGKAIGKIVKILRG